MYDNHTDSEEGSPPLMVGQDHEESLKAFEGIIRNRADAHSLSAMMNFK